MGIISSVFRLSISLLPSPVSAPSLHFIRSRLKTNLPEGPNRVLQARILSGTFLCLWQQSVALLEKLWVPILNQWNCIGSLLKTEVGLSDVLSVWLVKSQQMKHPAVLKERRRSDLSHVSPSGAACCLAAAAPVLLLAILNCYSCWCCATLLTSLFINVELIWKTTFADSVRCRFNSAFLLLSSSDMVFFLITAAKTLLNKKADVKVRRLTSLLPSPPFTQLDTPWHDFPDRNMNSCSF